MSPTDRSSADRSRAGLRTVRRLFEQTLDQPVGSRRRFLERACGSDRELLRRVQALLDADSAFGPGESGASPQPEAVGRVVGSDGAGEELQSLDRYEILRPLGRGSSSTVFLARRIDCPEAPAVAVKVLREDLRWPEPAQVRFELERRLLARFDHPSIARFLDSGSDRGRPFVVLEYVEGSPITHFCDSRCLSVRDRLQLVLTVCGAIAYAHRHLVVHRDIKPSNVLVSSAGVPKLLDFGIAKLLDGTADETATEQRILTPNYASPEQIAGRPITTASDVYSMGVLLFELLCGYRPFERPPSEVLSTAVLSEVGRPSERLRELELGNALAIATARGTQPAALVRELSGDLDTLIGKASRLDPEDRYASIELLAEDIERYLDDQPIRARPRSWPYRAGKWAKRNRLAAAGLAGTLALLLALAALMVSHQQRLAAAHADAERARERAESMSSFLIRTFETADPRGEQGGALTVRELLRSAAAQIDSSLPPDGVAGPTAEEDRSFGEASVRSDLEHAVGTALAHFGELQQAKALLLSALGHRQASADPAISTTLMELVHVCQGLGLYTEGRSYAERAWNLEAARPDTDGAALARAHRQLARALLYEGRHREAEPHARAAVELDLELEGHPVTATADSLLVLGLVLADNARLDEGRRHVERALALLENDSARDTVLGGEVLQALASIARRQGRIQASLRLSEELLDSRARWLGETSQAYTEALHRHGLAHSAAGDRQRAAEILGEVVELFAALSPPNPLGEAHGLRDLGAIHLLNGDYDVAEAALRRAFSLGSSVASDRPLPAQVLANLVALERRRGNPEAARAHLDRALARLPDGPPQDPFAWLRLQTHLADQLHLLGREKEGRALLAETLDQSREYLGPEHTLTLALEARIEKQG
ncbi:MAG: serine/threonine-protein kinase [Holophagales bacterium]|nr:serine/threonine-protein kinase [Holophagales bacterium]